MTKTVFRCVDYEFFFWRVDYEFFCRRLDYELFAGWHIDHEIKSEVGKRMLIEKIV